MLGILSSKIALVRTSFSDMDCTMCFQLIEGEALAVLEVALHLGAWPTQYYL
jgi:hypothetical protein